MFFALVATSHHHHFADEPRHHVDRAASGVFRKLRLLLTACVRNVRAVDGR